MGKLFGTDGVRGEANSELTPELAFKIGRAGAYVLSKEEKHSPTILVGMDTRLSGDMLESALTAGMCSIGAKVIVASVIPTPAVAFLVRHFGFDAGVVISASHNPFADNGIKFFNKDGYKLKDEMEEEIEDYISNRIEEIPRPCGDKLGKKVNIDKLSDIYVNFLINTMDEVSLKGIKVVVDCANGATYDVAPKVFNALGADAVIIHNKPDGTNINSDCGSTHMESLIQAVLDEKAQLGIAYDGDGDRCLMVDEKGNIIDGDQILSICATYMKQKGTLNNNGFVGTVMSNLGLVIMCEELGIELIKANVGDRYVLEEMISKGYNLGGEQSGHVIFLDFNTTGDGLLTSLQVMKFIAQEKKLLSEINDKMKVLPQVLVNAKVNNSKKYNYLDNEIIKKEIEQLEKKFGSKGRVLVRASGTEPLVRVMIEGEDLEVLTKEADRMASLIEEILS